MKMTRVIIFILFVLPFIASSQVLYNEDFNLPDGTTTDAGATAWTSSYSGSGYFATSGDVFFIYNLDSEGVWTSQNIDISSYGYAVIDIAGYVYYANAGDYLRFYYSVDGGPEVLFGNFSDGFFSGAVGASSIVSGSSLVITVRAFNTTFLESYQFDDVIVTGITTLYSRASTAWNTAGTWSTVGLGGASCTCTPNDKTRVIVGSGYAVTIDGTGTTEAIDVIVQSGGSVTFTANEDLDIHRGGTITIETSASLTSSAYTGSQIDFEGAFTNSVTVEGSLTIGDIDVNDAATISFSGGGTLSVQDDILISSSAQLTNSVTGSFSIAGDLQFETNASGAGFDNNEALTITGNLSFQNDDNIFTNAGTVTFANIAAGTGDDDCQLSNTGTANFQSVDTNDANFIINNAGTINQSGNFINGEIDAGSDYINAINGVWNWTLTPNTTYDTDVATVMDLTATGNTFNYSGAGAQRIIPTTYHHLLLSTSGAKDANNASFAVQGDWTVSGTATFTEGTGTITLNGTGTQTITNPSGETFYNLTINNSFGASPQITTNNNVTVANVLTMTDGNVNLNGNTLTLTSTATGALVHGLSSASGWMYDGSFARARPGSTNINVGIARSLFPLGSASDWRPFFAGQNSTAATAGTMTVTHTDATTTSDVSFSESIVRRHDSYWTPRTTASGGTYTLRAGGTNFGTIANAAHLRMSTSSGIVGTHAAGSGGPDWRINRTAVSQAQLNANNFHLASTDATNSPLPIELISFTAELKNSVVELKWSTASETNNDFFTIERATDVEHFEAIIEEDGMGTTKALHKYSVIDASPLYGRSYYRLKQTDFDGKFSYSPLQVINYEGPKYATLSAFPNPLSNSDLTIRIAGLKDATIVPVQILNMQGQTIYEKVIEVKIPGVVIEEISSHYFPNSGLYIIKAGETLYLTQKIVVE